jgi:hypothetical protein
LEAALFSGGVRSDGPTKAKPMDTAPKTEKQAKPDDSYYAELAEIEASHEEEKKETAAAAPANG